MTRPRKAPLWRGRFLRALARTGNVSASAEAAGVDKSTAYLRRKSDGGFAGRWARALEKAKEVPLHERRPAPAKAGTELIARRTKHGTKLVRVAEGRWCAAVEAKITAELERTGSYRAAAKAGEISTVALSNRRKNDPALAAKLAAAEAIALERLPGLPGLLAAAAIASFDPEVEDEGLGKVDIAQAIAIVRLKGGAGAGGASGRRARAASLYVKSEPSIEEVRDEVLARIAAIKRHRERRGEDPPAQDRD